MLWQKYYHCNVIFIRTALFVFVNVYNYSTKLWLWRTVFWSRWHCLLRLFVAFIKYLFVLFCLFILVMPAKNDAWNTHMNFIQYQMKLYFYLPGMGLNPEIMVNILMIYTKVIYIRQNSTCIPSWYCVRSMQCV